MIYRRDNFHLVFDNAIGYNLSCRICKVLAGIGILERDYVKIREFRGDMTLRVGPAVLTEETKPVPVDLHQVFNPGETRTDGYITTYMMALRIARRLFRADHDPEDETNQGKDSPDHRREERPVKAIVERPGL